MMKIGELQKDFMKNPKYRVLDKKIKSFERKVKAILAKKITSKDKLFFIVNEFIEHQ